MITEKSIQSVLEKRKKNREYRRRYREKYPGMAKAQNRRDSEKRKERRKADPEKFNAHRRLLTAQWKKNHPREAEILEIKQKAYKADWYQKNKKKEAAGAA